MAFRLVIFKKYVFIQLIIRFTQFQPFFIDLSFAVQEIFQSADPELQSILLQML
jgi:hypothetical protein